MPPQARATRTRLAGNENDENSSTTRLTRAQAAALKVDELSMPAKAALQTKKSTVNGTAASNTRKRAALGDVSNVGKVDGVAGKKAKGLVSKAAQPTGIEKKTARPTTRTALGSKPTNSKTQSGSGTINKRKVVTDTANTKIKAPVNENEHPSKKQHLIPEERERSETPVEVEVEKPEVSLDKAEVQDAPFEYPPGVKDLDSEDLEDPLMVAEYANEIFEYLRDLECKSIPNPQYMSHQDELEWKTRGILVDWLVEVHTRFHLLPETLFLAVNLIDRFLSEKVVQLDRLQLVGITAMFIASKYEEVLSPHVENFKRIADDGFTEAEILSAERFILSTLNYDLSYPNPMNFLRRVSKADNYDIQSRTIGKYLMEIGLLDHRFMAYRPSHIAAGAMYLARLMLDRGEWDETLSYYAGYTEDEIEPVVHLMVDYLARPVTHEAFFKKYASKKFLKASILARQWAKKNAVLFGITDVHLSLDELS
ncbi:cyclin B [Fusarium oxysporum f. sp. raphani 54005]|uniref:Cyclin B n=24 Tax=Fusarium oxysporum TaxID=5507 RepID=W9IPF3_FUSOX|nr:cyclin B [Fusarium oxysporum f. sp. lycopersici 4287]XP_018231712.1 cyclin B [Fusarium oxysporum f. sp. lycopersici 4287]XP_018231713.1 cyclin B [Fusarium oxysporum f. sp. lycopersici 4287]XP_018231714.1 cyclin B [Fusarium oxysporum f. sp. lycopersici 4287]XP_059463899.1 cyclin-like protein [Fusarium oxysporum Fo47]EWY94656.1 cyclin B [Fusarium oxysporum NRRL 32931]EWZ88526.1 cyclin B [Fusarium oxysporum f. sp. lycopersici MN25]EXA53836.1 cyclin B [Fusarium oxysporum f. sp. pisi HDV247]E